MNARERVLTALRCEEPDRVPYCEIGIDRALARRMLGWTETTSPKTGMTASMETNPYTLDEAKALAADLGMDNLYYVLRAPVYADRLPGEEGRLFYGPGQIKSAADLGLLQLPDPNDDSLYAGAKEFVEQKGDYALWFITRLGIFPTMLSMGIEHFSLALYDDRDLVEEILDRYCDWAAVVAEKVSGLGFDAYISTDDLAFKTGPFFSPKLFRELVMPRYRRVAEHIRIPWIIHSDGDITSLLPDFLDLGVVGINPVEKGAMDIQKVKRMYGDRLCLLGNVDLNLLGLGSPAEVDAEVHELIRTVGPGGGYVVTSGNSLAAYVQPDNVRAMIAAVRKYGRYPL
jgi:uroporphyrinogen-III decarboxylase